ncbi:flavocytochrome c [Mesosutterella sp. OilRF-GAM-744-9]|uniref:Flavocytochrome c n=1 Tax=Mesosutterella porci TaxID=2915351 RepID=A0ABS9MQS9_9BURK|nr:flavocytochrome c [Mesosutterella sp. oilRF-744-WT-GAM-9]MCG5030742.1 flavocytochrome c [Mesosutterella sp. oilRF-744-WT-GAM-9]
MINRRNFLKAGLAAAASMGASEAFAVPTNAPAKFDETYDFIAIGAGNAGLSAASHGAEAGLKVLVLEKLAFVGGSSAICGGSWAASGTAMQKEAGIKDSEELFFDDMIKTGKGENDPDVVRAYIKAANREYDWLLAHGVKAHDVHAAGGMSVPRVHAFTPDKVVEFYRDYAEKKGAKILTNAPVERLLWNAQKERVEGVRARVNGKVRTFRARYGVLLACGGFANNQKLLGKYVPAMKKARSVSGVGNTGDGLIMALSLGADVLDTNYVKATYGFVPGGNASEKSYIYYNGGIIVNKAGKRFVNESLSYKLIGDAALVQPEAKTFTVFDNAVRKEGMAKDRREIKMWKDVESKGTTPYGFVGKTIEEAAEKAGIPPAALAQTIKEYNELAPKGEDPLGRKHLSGRVGTPVKLTEGPWVVMPCTAAMIATYCGVRIDPTARVIDVYGQPIKGLYAAGEMLGGVHGAAYMTGTAFSKAAAFGHVAADQAVAAKKAGK